MPRCDGNYKIFSVRFCFVVVAEISPRIRSIAIVIWHGFRIGYANVDYLVRRHTALHRPKYATFRSKIYRIMNSSARATTTKVVWAKVIVLHRARAPEPLCDAHETNWRRFHAAYRPKRPNCIWNRTKFRWFTRIALAIWNRWPDCKSPNWHV